MSWSSLPALDALLNLTSALLLALGYYFIRTRQVRRHRVTMTTAFCTSTLFLIGYLANHAHAGIVRYQGIGLKRTVYFAILTSHTILAVIILPLVLRTFYLALKQRFEVHRRWARWTLPIWFYVSVTGVVIYEMLY
jgi:uncharacterized membrane protein YozB (DUF420 family)